jgi:hypothetical protein
MGNKCDSCELVNRVPPVLNFENFKNSSKNPQNILLSTNINHQFDTTKNIINQDEFSPKILLKNRLNIETTSSTQPSECNTTPTKSEGLVSMSEMESLSSSSSGSSSSSSSSIVNTTVSSPAETGKNENTSIRVPKIVKSPGQKFLTEACLNAPAETFSPNQVDAEFQKQPENVEIIEPKSNEYMFGKNNCSFHKTPPKISRTFSRSHSSSVVFDDNSSVCSSVTSSR